jgi:CheY-like chemotaxis protein
MKILVVDDEADVCKTIALMLDRLGYACETAASGLEAIQKHAEQSFDVILTDLGMPGMNGLELAQQIKATAPGVRIILITGWPLQLNDEQLRQHGVECVINKPVRLKELLAVLTTGSQGR